MLNKEKHQLIMGQILRDIYSDISIAPFLGFKGGTSAYFFYALPRFSVDLDFDLLSTSDEDKELVFQKIIAILSKYGQVKNQRVKRFTIFALLSYGDEDHNIKVEVNVRKLVNDIKFNYEYKEYLGISMLVAKKDYLFAGKISALTLRNELAMRDVFDIHYFAKNNWEINVELVEERTGKTLKEYLGGCVSCIEKIKGNQLLRGLGELVGGEKEKAWIKEHLKDETIFMLKNYQSVQR